MRNVMLIAVLCVLMCGVASAKTDIFSGGNQFSAVVGSNSAVASWGWTPAEKFSWGFRVSGVLTEAADVSASKWDTTLLGVGCEFPVVGLESLFEGLPLGGELYLGIGIDVDVKNDYKAYVPIDVGANIMVNDDGKHKLFFRVSKAVTELNKGGDTPTNDLRFGVCLMW